MEDLKKKLEEYKDQSIQEAEEKEDAMLCIESCDCNECFDYCCCCDNCCCCCG